MGPVGAECLRDAQCLTLSEGLAHIATSSAAEGFISELNLMSGAYLVKGMAPMAFDASIVSSHVRIVGATRTVIRGGEASVFTVGAGSPKVELLGLHFSAFSTRPAITVLGGEVLIQNCTFEANAMSALHIEGGHVRVVDSRFIGNGGGALHGGAIKATGGQLSIVRCELEGNQARVDGGALYAQGKSVVLVEDSRLHSNSASQRGGAICTVGTVEMVLANQTMLRDNVAGSGNSVFLDASVAYSAYVLPAPRGHWVAHAKLSWRPGFEGAFAFRMLTGALDDGECSTSSQFMLSPAP